MIEKIFDGHIFEYPDGRTYHLGIRGEEISTYMLTMGSESRLKKVYNRLEEPIEGGERLRWVSGYYGDIKVFAFSSGMGVGSALITISEALKKVSDSMGHTYLIRIGTAGPLQEIPKYSIVVAKSVVRNESGTRHIVFGEYPADMDPIVYLSTLKSAIRHGYTYGRNLFLGKVETKDDLYYQEGFHNSPVGNINKARYEAMSMMGVLATDMEASTLPILRDYFNTRYKTRIYVGAVLLILKGIEEDIGGREEILVDIGLDALATIDRFLKGEDEVTDVLRFISS